MASSSTCVLLFALWFALSNSCEKNCTYTVVTSRVINAGKQHQFSVTTLCDVQTNFTLKAWISSASLNSTRKAFKLKTGITKVYSLAIPKILKEEEHFFCLEAIGGLTFYENRSVSVSRKNFSLLVQTDKAVYKPGDRVLFRILAFNPDLKPSKFAVNVTITDPKGNRIFQSNLPTKNGIAKGSLPLSKATIYGKWTIAVKSKGESNYHRFKVKEYVLPKYKVELLVPKRFHINVNNPANQTNLPIAVNARYTFSQPVRGTALFTLTHIGYYNFAGNKPTITKTIKLEDGKAHFEVTTTDLLGLIPCFYGQPSLEYQSFEVEVNVTETATGNVISEKKQVISRTGRLNLDTKTKGWSFKPGFPLKIMFLLKQIDGDLPELSDVQFQDGSPKSIPVVVQMGFGGHADSTLEQRFLANLTHLGLSYLTIDTNANIKSIRIESAFYDEYSNDTLRSYAFVSAFETKTEEQLQLDLETDSASTAFQPGKVTTFIVRSSTPITSYQYQIFSKNSLIVSRQINGENSTIHSFSINATADLSASLAPEAVVVASYVTADGELIADTLVVTMTKFFFNEVKVSFDKNTSHPSGEVRVNVEASSGSSLALLAVDQSVRLLKTGNDITTDRVTGELFSYGNQYRPPSRPHEDFLGRSIGGVDTTSMFSMANVMVITNNYIHDIQNDDDEEVEEEEVSDSEGGGGLMNRPKKRMHSYQSRTLGASSLVSDSINVVSSDVEASVLQTPRTEFPETWIWADVDEAVNASTTLTFKIPDTITSWVLSGFAIGETAGLAVAEPTEITVFKPLFVSPNLPYSVVRGEEFSLVVTIFNYLETDLEVDVTLAKSAEFRIRKCDSLNLLQSFESEVTKKILIRSKESENVYFWIVPSAVGLVPLEVTASSGRFVDIVKTNLLVKPEGQPQSYSTSSLLGSSVNNNSFVDFHVTLPPNDILVADSVVVEVTLIGNIFASTIENIRNLVNLPSGCGEQNIITFAPNVYILNFLSATNELTDEKENDLTDLLLSGFSQQLTFQRRDGSYSAFGDKDAEGSVWLSAFVIKSFRHSKVYLSYEPKMVTKTLKWILSHQNADGSFAEPARSKILHSKMQGGSSSGVSLTAYVLIAIHENKIFKPFVKTIDGSIANATSYLESHYASYSNNPYVLSIVTYAFYLVKSSHFEHAFSLLDALATVDGDSMHWKTQAMTPQEDNVWKPFYEKPLTYDIEATSYALLTYTARANANALLIAKWLIMQRNEAGGYRSTQDTIIALEALSKFARAMLQVRGSETDLSAKVLSDSDNATRNFDRISKQNSFVLQNIELPGDSKKVTVSLEGLGYAIAQLKVKYNIQTATKHPQLELNVSSASSRGHLVLSTSLRWLGEEASGMVMLEVETPTGWNIKDEDVVVQELESRVSKVERLGSKMVLYLDELTGSFFDVEMILENKLSTFGGKPAIVKAYRYYEPGTVVTAFYSATGKQNWLIACPECCS